MTVPAFASWNRIGIHVCLSTVIVYTGQDTLDGGSPAISPLVHVSVQAGRPSVTVSASLSFPEAATARSVAPRST